MKFLQVQKPEREFGQHQIHFSQSSTVSKQALQQMSFLGGYQCVKAQFIRCRLFLPTTAFLGGLVLQK